MGGGEWGKTKDMPYAARGVVLFYFLVFKLACLLAGRGLGGCHARAVLRCYLRIRVCVLDVGLCVLRASSRCHAGVGGASGEAEVT